MFGILRGLYFFLPANLSQISPRILLCHLLHSGIGPKFPYLLRHYN